MLEVVIKGPPKSGKTTLLKAIAEMLHGLGAEVSVLDDSRTQAIVNKDVNSLRGKKVVVRTDNERNQSRD